MDTLELTFNEHVLMNGSEITILGSNGTTLTPSDFSYDATTHAGTWTFSSPLPLDKYRIELSTAVTDVGGNALDGEWDNLFGVDGMGMPTPDTFSPVQPGRTFLSGNGVAGGDFSFFFSQLPGDGNQDGVVTSAVPCWQRSAISMAMA